MLDRRQNLPSRSMLDPASPATAALQCRLAHFNRHRLTPRLDPAVAYMGEARLLAEEAAFVAAARAEIAPLAADAPADADGFVAWFDGLKACGPGQGDTLFPWLAGHATAGQLRWFLFHEIAGEAGFEDLLALTQVKMPRRAKLEMARNFWDEMGRGQEKGMHGPMLERLARHLDLAPTPEATVTESLMLGNLMVALAHGRDFAFHSVGALGAIELTAPTRAGFVVDGLKRVGVEARHRHYFALHAVLDVRHAEAWTREVLHPLVSEDPRRARPIAEGALMRLRCGERCFARYRREFGI